MMILLVLLLLRRQIRPQINEAPHSVRCVCPCKQINDWPPLATGSSSTATTQSEAGLFNESCSNRDRATLLKAALTEILIDCRL